MNKISVLIGLLLFWCSNVEAQFSLDACLEYAQKNNAELLAQSEAVNAASINHKSSRSRLLPEVNGRAELDHFWRIPVQAFPAEIIGGEPGTFVPVRISTPWTASYGADATLRIFDPQEWQSIKLSSLQWQMQQGEFHSLKQLLERNVKMAYYSVLAEKENRDAISSLLESYREIHRLLSLQFERGLIDQITINQSVNLLRGREEALSQAETALQSAYLDLKFWMGYPLNEKLEIVEETPAPVFVENDFNARLLPDYEASRLRLAQAEQQWRISRSRMLPYLSGVAGFQRVAFRNSFDFFQQGDWFNVGSVGLRLNIPILSARQMFYEPSHQKALLKQATLQFENYQKSQERAYHHERMRLEQANLVYNNQQENLALAKENERLAKSKIEKGIINMVELRQIQDDLYQVQQKLTTARLNYLRHYIELNYLQNID